MCETAGLVVLTGAYDISCLFYWICVQLNSFRLRIDRQKLAFQIRGTLILADMML